MTAIFSRPVAGPATHAFVIGVGGYPDAKPDRGVKKGLRTVKDLPSAADSAKLMCDWLIANRDNLEAPLASLEVLISEPAEPPTVSRYAWANAQPVAAATTANVLAAGTNWVNKLTARSGDTGFFYACGHGAGLSSQPVIFLEDLNHSAVQPWAHHNIGATAAAFKQLDRIKTAFFFADTCREFLPRFELGNVQDLSRFVSAFDPFEPSRDKISLLCAASDGILAYEGSLQNNLSVKIGRFTQMLIQALDGALARWRSPRWVVHPGAIFEDIKLLHRAYRPDWRGEPFEPSHPLVPNEVFPITVPPEPLLPILITTDPEQAMSSFDLRIFDNPSRTPPCVADRGSRSAAAWPARVRASLHPHYAVAEDGAATYQELFVPNAPSFDQRIPIG